MKLGHALRGLGLALALCLGLCACSKEQLLAAYDAAASFAGRFALSSSWELAGQRAFGLDSYTGAYHADYHGDTCTEYVFGGTGLAPADGGALTVSCTLRVDSGLAKVFWLRGDDGPLPLLETGGSTTVTLALPAGQNLIGVACSGFTGSLDLTVF